ncbi:MULTISPECIES: hypothetical protein [Pseudomonas]|uniref:DUF1090 domain-containing protein n=1 Tax=Pseudomonas phytophila TaxID=2867264 RepID=A0ABY6FAN4_9PSED|nr:MULTISPECIES: hypothetical protein [Pseudomonas]MDU8361964.1 hypothetical protein [Pseudomonas syringae group sp. J309-1]UXZ94921.1 hypothetical protein K3169_21580 [Pseudomonas phytophila]
MKIMLCLVMVLMPCLAQAAWPTPSACYQAHRAASQRLAQAIADQDNVGAAKWRGQLATIVAQCRAAQQAQDNRRTQQRYLQERRQQDQINQQRNAQRRIVEQQRLRQRIQQQHLNQRNMPDIRY